MQQEFDSPTGYQIMKEMIQLIREIVWCFTAITILAMLILWWEGAFTKGCLNLLWTAMV
jgi:hypothetical protein